MTTPHDKPKSPHSGADLTDPLLAIDPFSEDNEVTVIQVSPKPASPATDDEVTEVSAVHADALTNSTPVALESLPPTPAVSETPVSIPTDGDSDARSFKLPRPRRRPLWPLKRTLIVLGAFFTLIAIVPLLESALKEYRRSRAPAPSRFAPLREELRLGPVTLTSPDQASATSFKPGSHAKLTFRILKWPQSNTDLNFSVDFRIYSHRGELVHFESNHAAFSGRVDAATEALDVEEDITLSRTIPPGVYRLRFDISERSSGRNAVAQTRLRIVP